MALVDVYIAQFNQSIDKRKEERFVKRLPS